VATAEPPAALQATPPAAALERLRALRPQPHLGDRAAHLPAVERFLAGAPDAGVEWISDGVAGVEGQAFIEGLTRMAQDRTVTVFKGDRAAALALAGADNVAGHLAVTVLRPEPNGRDAGTLRALDLKNLPLADIPFAFPPGETVAEARFDLPVEVRNAIARVEVLGEGSAGAVALVDERGKRRRVGLVFGGTADQSQPLLSPSYYLGRALQPYAELREGRGAVGDAVGQLIDEQVSVLALADVGALDPATSRRVAEFVERGGLLLRFAGSRLAAGNDDLVPVRLRRGGRSLGGTLSWDAPKTLAPFTRESPYYGLAIPADLGVRRQILAEPDGDLASRTWASLQDGTPVVTAAKRGDGLVVLFHVTADTTWSNLPLSGLFVDMLRRTIAFAGAPEGAAEGRTANETVAPRLVLDGFGALVSPPGTARAVSRSYAERATSDHPPGYYGPLDASLAVNALKAGDRLAALDYAPLNARTAPLTGDRAADLRGPTLTLALLLFLADTLASLWLAGNLAGLGRRARRAGAAAALSLGLGLGALSGLGEARAQGAAPPDRPAPARSASPEELQSALVTRLAYVVTGDGAVDEVSRAGLSGLTQVLQSRTAMEPGEPIGVDPARDELSFYPVLYWPIVASRPQPPEAAIRRLDAFMKGGGTVIFDTRDAGSARAGTQTPEAQYLRRMLAALDIPELEPVPRDHVLTKTFYILEGFPGRYAGGQTWVEALPPPNTEDRRPARAGDGVSPLVITGNDLASAWAVGRRGEALFPVQGSDPRQREYAYRGGVNLVMYALTGNYKADQVHVPALLERLGQ
jgi:hypothetical protein